MKSTFHFFGILLALSVVFTSCGEDDSNPIAAKISLINAAPADEAASVDFLIDDEVQNTNAIAFPGNTEYFNVTPLEHTLRINQAGSDNTIASRTVSPGADDFHTVILYSADTVGTFLTDDDMSTPAANTAHVRFFHLVPNGPTVTVGTVDDADNFSPLFENRAFETDASIATSQNFTPVPAGTYSIEVRTESLDVPVITLDSVQLEGGRIYTLYARGEVDLSFDVGVEVIEYTN